MTPMYGFLADDLTGASDVMAQAHAHGMSAMLVLDPRRLTGSADVVGIAGPLRSLSGGALESGVRAGLDALAAFDLEVLLYKVCSTFDSSPTVGSIGRAIELIGERFPDHGPVPVLPAQPEFGRYTAFSQHFGAYQNQVYRLDRHPVMAHHPSTPMAESDLRRMLAAQFRDGVVSPGLHLTAYSDGSFDEQWQQLRRQRGQAFVVDAVDTAQMEIAARALIAHQPDTGPAIVVGSGGIMAALARNHTGRRATPARLASSSGPTLVVSASASATTASQIDDAVAHGWVDVPIPVGALCGTTDSSWLQTVEEALTAGRDVIAHTARGPQDPRLSSGTRAEHVGTTIGAAAGRMARSGLTHDLVICGGDTSSHALAAMRISELRVRELFVTAGPICVADEDSDVAGCRLLLKGGQVGGPSLFRLFAGQLNEER
jgi:3-oxoisoapionate kinase